MMLPARSPTHFPDPRMSHWRISVSPAWLEICNSCSKLLREHSYGEQRVVNPLGTDRMPNPPFAMINALQSELSINVVASIIVSLLFLVAGFFWGKYKERRRKFGRNLDEYDFYPFTVSRENFGEFSLKDFRLGMHYFLKN